MEYLDRSIDDFRRLAPSASILLGGDFSQLDVAMVSINTGLAPVHVSVPIRGGHVLDMLMISMPGFPAVFNIKVVTPLINTDHKAIILTTAAYSKPSQEQTSGKQTVQDQEHESKRQYTSAFRAQGYAQLAAQYSGESRIGDCLGQFLSDYGRLVECVLPNKRGDSQSVASTDPPFMTPEIKSLIRRKCRLLARADLRSIRHRSKDMENDCPGRS